MKKKKDTQEEVIEPMDLDNYNTLKEEDKKDTQLSFLPSSTMLVQESDVL